MTECTRCAPTSVTFISGPTAACTVPDRRVQYTGNQYALCTLSNFQTKVLGVRLRSCWPCRAGGSRRVTTCSQLYVPGWHMHRRVRHGIDSEYETNERQSRQGPAASPPFGEDQFCHQSACDDDSKRPCTDGEKKESMHQCARR